MKKMFALVLFAVCSALFAGCGADDVGVESAEPEVTLETQASGGGQQCPVTLQCPAAPSGYIFMNAVNNCSTSITCKYRTTQIPYSYQNQVLTIPNNCDVCRPLGSSSEMCGQITYSQIWTCSAS